MFSCFERQSHQEWMVSTMELVLELTKQKTGKLEQEDSYHWQVPLKTTAFDLDAMDILSYQHDITFGVDTTVSDYWCWMFEERRESGEARSATFFS